MNNKARRRTRGVKGPGQAVEVVGGKVNRKKLSGRESELLDAGALAFTLFVLWTIGEKFPMEQLATAREKLRGALRDYGVFDEKDEGLNRQG